MDIKKIEAFRESVIEWYRKHGDRDLPWRRTRDAWAVLTAAFLLRKTTAKQVLKIYNDFLKKYPSHRELAEADEAEIIEAIRPLGIERQRTRDLKRIAEYIERDFQGGIPCRKEELKKLPGVGEYIASEVLLVACGEPMPLLDRNMIRVLERVFGVKSEKKRPHTDRRLWMFAKKLVPSDPEKAILFNYGILDMARKLCKAKKPNCNKCPMKKLCVFYNKKS